jgi:hypothetical protein
MRPEELTGTTQVCPGLRSRSAKRAPTASSESGSPAASMRRRRSASTSKQMPRSAFSRRTSSHAAPT